MLKGAVAGIVVSAIIGGIVYFNLPKGN
jgi:hypothetical protein